MADETTYLIRLASWLGQALGGSAPLFSAFSSESLGLELPDTVLQSPAVVAALQQSKVTAGKVGETATGLETAAGTHDEFNILAAFSQFGIALGQFYAALNSLANSVQANVTAATVPDPAARAAAGSFAATLAKALSDYSIASAITERTPGIAFALKLAGLLDWQYQDRDPGHSLARAHVKKGLHLDRIKGLINDPATHFRQTLGWGDPGFDPTGFFLLVKDFFPREFDIKVGVQAGDPFLRACMLVRRDSSVSPPGLLFTLLGELDADEILRNAVTKEWGVGVSSNFRMVGGVSGQLSPPLAFKLTPLTGQITGEYRTFFERNESARPFDIVGGTGGLLGISANNISAGVGLKAEWSISDRAAKINPLFFANIDALKLKIGSADADSFIGKLLSGAEIEGQFDFGLEWQADTGLRITASGGVEIALPIHKQIGPIEFETVYVVLKILSDGTLSLEVSTALAANLGPLSASVDRIGAMANLRLAQGTDAKFGPFDLDLKFKPPSGLGISIDAGPITGGGFIFFDPPNGRYAGVLALSLYSIQVKAIGLLDTKLPNGESGYSFLVIISVEFTPIQLGFGFTLNGVGGLCGINRNFVTEALQAGLRAHSLDHILFPKDPVKNAPAIISDLRVIFPPAEGRYVFGPMIELGWGGGLNLVTAEFGIILAIPSPVIIAILGQLNVNVPNPAAPVIELHLDVLGIIDFGKKLFSLDASLHDSRIVIFTIYGDMAMRLSWGDHPSFALSIGGLNPHFQPPDGFPQLRRLTIALSYSDNFRLSIQTYFAITSNSFQFGAHAELYIGVSAFNVYGWLGFDALFIFTPFSFIVDFTAGLALRSGTSTLLGISLDGELSGPTPWHAVGNAHVTLLFFEISCHVDIKWGEDRQSNPPLVDAWQPLRDGIANVQNWSGGLPSGVPAPVTLAAPKPGDQTIYVDPSGTLTMRERVLPLNQLLTKFGEAAPGPQTEFDLPSNGVSLGGVRVPYSIVRDKFAPAQFEKMSDQEKLSRPSFEDRDAGFSVGEGQLDFGGVQLGLDVAFADIYVDDHAPPPPSRPVLFNPTLIQQIAWARTNGAAQSALRATALGKFALAASAKPLVELAEEQYVVASTSDLSQRLDITHPVTKGEAFHALSMHLAQNPGEHGQLQVVPLYELAA